MFGSDWPVSTLDAAYGEVHALYRELTRQLSPVEQEAIFGATATGSTGWTRLTAASLRCPDRCRQVR
jgi:L-fuconolactonase